MVMDIFGTWSAPLSGSLGDRSPGLYPIVPPTRSALTRILAVPHTSGGARMASSQPRSCHGRGRHCWWRAAVVSLLLLLLGSGCAPADEEHPVPPEQREQTLDRTTSTEGDVADIAGQALPENVQEAEVDDNVDGDTIEVVFPNDDRPVDVRLIGIDAPESVRPNSPVECYGPESSDRLAELLEPGTTVYLERDVSDTDQFDRLLRHVWVVDDAERAAQADGAGLWGACHG